MLLIFVVNLLYCCPQVSWRWRSSSVEQESILTSWICSARWWTLPMSWKSLSEVNRRNLWTELIINKPVSCGESRSFGGFSGKSVCAWWRAKPHLRQHRINQWTDWAVLRRYDLSVSCPRSGENLSSSFCLCSHISYDGPSVLLRFKALQQMFGESQWRQAHLLSSSHHTSSRWRKARWINHFDLCH